MSCSPRNVCELATSLDKLKSSAELFARLFQVCSGTSYCTTSSDLQVKYGVEKHSRQFVISITNRVTGEQAWYNPSRKQKPQTFSQARANLDPTSPTKPCDFCNWQSFTAVDSFGRIETEHAVTASNLFKYCQPCHGVVILKPHQPMCSSLSQLAGVLGAAQGWLEAAAAAYPSARHPLLLWNCLPRAGASQYHAHAQVLLSEVPFPTLERCQLAAQRYSCCHPRADWYQDMRGAHQEVGLLRCFGADGDRAYCYPHLAPLKDCEVQVQGSCLSSPALQQALWTAMRALTERLGVSAFNLAVYNIDLPQRPSAEGPPTDLLGAPPLLARLVSRGNPASPSSDFGGLEVFAGASIGHTDPYTVAAALDDVMARG